MEVVSLQAHCHHVVTDTTAMHCQHKDGSTFTFTFPLGWDHLDRAQVNLDGSFNCEVGCYGKKIMDEECQSPDNADSISSEPTVATMIRGIDPSILMFDKTSDLLLVADDNKDIRDYISALFSPFLPVVVAKDGMEALELVRKLRPSLVLSDVSMPRLSGIELLAAIKNDNELESTPVILV